MASNFKIPPALEEDSNYESWKNELEMWRLITDLPKTKQALAVVLSLKGKSREKALEVEAASLNMENGIETLLTKLDEIFLQDKNELAYSAYTNFESLKRQESTSINTYIIEFEKLYEKIKKYQMVLPDAVLAFKLLNNANLSLAQRQLALTAANDRNYETMKKALRRIFGDTNTVENMQDGIKMEALLTSRQGQNFNTNPRRKNFSSGRQSRTQLNPLDPKGNPSKCSICESIYHWRRQCPHKKEKVLMMEQNDDNSDSEKCHITLFTKSTSAKEYEILTVEAYGAAILDTACSKTVCGQVWYDNYLSSLSDKDRNSIDTQDSHKLFKFGDGEAVYSSKRVTIPAKIGNKLCSIEAEVVPVEIPLLLSKTSLQRAGTILNLQEDTAVMFDQQIRLELTSNGHYCIDILKDYDADKNDILETSIDTKDILVVNEQMSDKEKRTIFEKLHKQFGHASTDRIKRLLTCAGQKISSESSKVLHDVIDKCDTCLMHKPTPRKPAVCLPLAGDFNETVAVDLHELQPNVYYLHIIDIFTRFSSGAIIKTKQADEFVKQFLKCWISVYGAPATLFSDNGGEFNNEAVRDMAANFNIEIKTTAAYSPFSNGILERHNKTLTEAIQKIKYDNNCNWDNALSWALMAKNSMVNMNGFSPYQLVFGRNPNLPSVLHDKPPALEGVTTSMTVCSHIKALYSARKAFTEAECSERIRRAIRNQIKPTGERFFNGDKVFYKRTDSPLWKGPGTVIGQDSVVVFIRHGGTYVRVHSSRVRKVESPVENDKKPTNDPAIKPTVEDMLDNDNDEGVVNVDPAGQDYPAGQDMIQAPIDNEENVIPQNQPAATDIDITKLKPGQVIEFTERNTGNLSVGKIISRAGKASTKLNKWYNMEYIEPAEKAGTKLSIDLSTVDIQDIHNDNNEQAHMTCDNDDILVVNNIQFDSAKQAELQSWIDNQVYEQLPDVGQKCITTRWVCSLKELPSGIIPKARLVARGFQDKETNVDKDSPTCGTESVRTVLAVIAQKGWNVHTTDIKTAFLQGAEMSRTIYLRPPKEANVSGHVWKLRKCVYGLSDASLSWYKRVREVMLENGASISRVDPAVFYWTDNHSQSVQGVLAAHVDDFIWGGTVEFSENIMTRVKDSFKIGREQSQEFDYLGIEICQKDSELFVSQNKYVENLHPIKIDKVRQSQKDSKLTDEELENLRSKAGQLLWLARQSRPEILFDVCGLESKIKTATVQQILEANKIVKKVKSDNVSLRYRYLGSDESIKIVVFTDASLGNLSDGATQGGHFIALMGENGKISPLSWQSKRLRRVVRSTLAGETLALAEGMDCAIFLATLYSELSTGLADPKNVNISCVTDNKSLCEAIRSTKYVSERRLRLEISHIKELIKTKQIDKIIWSDTKHQLADCFTKKGASPLELLKTIERGICELNV